MSKKKATRTDPPEVIELFEIIADLHPPAGGFDGVIVRNVGSKYATQRDFFSGSGAGMWGGRWNPVGLEAIYASLDVITATHEAYQNFVAFGFPLTTIEPRGTAGAKVSLPKVLDLTDPKVRARIGFSLAELVNEDWKSIQASGEESWTQAIGRGAKAARFDALIVPSARHTSGKNIVILNNKSTQGVKIMPLALDKLPK